MPHRLALDLALPNRADAARSVRTAPRILLTATLRWPIAARLGMAFEELGCRAEAACPDGHPAELTRSIRRTHAYSPLKPLASLRAAIERAAPDLLIPCDDDAALHLHRLHTLSHADPAGTALCELIERSLGAPLACALATSRGQLMALARELGIRVPSTCVVASAGELVAGLLQHPLPAVLKLDRSWGGRGVAVVRNRDQALRAYEAMAAGPTLRHAATRLLLDRDPTLLRDALKRAPQTVTVQDFVAGTPANRAVACWKGRVLAGTSVEAVHTQGATGPATVVRVIDQPQMTEAVDRLVARLGISGFWGADFVLAASDGAAHLIELNPRATPICHLAITATDDLPAALLGAWLGRPVERAKVSTVGDTVALFPGEWRRHPASPHLRTSHHDVPWQEPELVLDGTRPPWAQRGLIARSWARWRFDRAGASPPQASRVPVD